jgi:hypothetical protein
VGHCDATRFGEARCDTAASDGAAPDEVGHDDRDDDDCARSDRLGDRGVVAGATTRDDDVLDADADTKSQVVDLVDSDDDGGGAAVVTRGDADDGSSSSSSSSSACSVVGNL